MLRQPVRSEARQVGGATRRSDLDLLRALVVGLVFFHSAVIFGPGEFPVKAGAEYPLAAVFLAFGATWGMPLLFVISGIASWYSLGSRGAAEFARERLRRLGVPLLVGLLTLVPLQVYLGRRRAGDTSSYADFSARFWDVRPSLEFPFVVRADPAGGLFETGHLWFLVCLLGFSLVLLPGLVLLGRPPGRRLIERLAGLLARPGTPRPSAPVRRLGVSVNDAVPAFYVLHEPVVVAVAGVVLGWRVAPGVQYLVISGVSLAATGLLCELGVRRHPVARYLFGLKPIRGTIDP